MATGINDTRTGFTDATIQKRAVTDMIKLIDWRDAPLLKLLGVDNEKNFQFVNFPQRVYEWLEDELPPQTGQLNEALDNSETAVDVDQGELYRVGHVIRVESEQMYVSAVAADTLTVTRGYAGTTADTHADNTPVNILFNAMPESADGENEYSTNADMYSNVRQIMSGTFKVSGSQQNTSDYGISDTKAYHMEKLLGGGKVGEKYRAGVVPQQLENTFWEGVYYKATTNATADQMGGFKHFVTTNVTDASSARLSRTMIEDEMQNCHDNNGMPDCILVGTFQKRVISQMFEGPVRTDRSEEQGGNVITTITTDFGDLDVICHRRFPNDEAFIFNKADMGWVTHRPFDTRELETQGDYEKVFYLGEYGFALCAEKHQARIHTLKTTW